MSIGKGNNNGKVSGREDTVYATPSQKLGVGGAKPPQPPPRQGTLDQHKLQPEPSPAKTAGELKIGSMVGEKYRITRKLGEGAMGEVYEAVHTALNDTVAIKVLSDKVKGDTGGKKLEQRFIQEAQSVASIKHENVVRVTDFGKTAEGRLYIVMEYLRGRDMAMLIHDCKGIPLERAKGIMQQVCRGVAEAHRMGIIHRDLKPENVILTRYSGKDDFVKVIDFGIAKLADERRQNAGGLTLDGIVFGTPRYMSPEQAYGKGVDHRTDIYAAGVMFYEMLCGKPPFEGDNTVELLQRHINEQPRKPSEARPDLGLPPEADEAVMRAMTKDKERRYATMAEFEAAIMAIPDFRKADALGLTLPPDDFPAASPPETYDENAPTQSTEKVPIYKKKSVIATALGGLALATGLGAYLHFAGIRKETSGAGSGGKAIAAMRVADAGAGKAYATPIPDAAAAKPDTRVRAHKIRILSRPEGAEVLRNGQGVGTTPFEIMLNESGEKAAFTLRKRGYREETVEVVPDGNKEISRSLAKEHRKKAGTKKEGEKGLRIPDYLKR